MPRRNGRKAPKKSRKVGVVTLPSPPELSGAGRYRVTWLNGLASNCLGYPLRRRLAWYRERVRRIVDLVSGEVVYKAA